MDNVMPHCEYVRDLLSCSCSKLVLLEDKVTVEAELLAVVAEALCRSLAIAIN